MLRYQTHMDFDYFFQSFGITVNLIMVAAHDSSVDVIRIGTSRVCAQAVGIIVAVATACLVAPQSGYTDARV